MIEDKLSKLNESIPEFNDVNEVKNNILQKQENKKINKHKRLFLRFSYIGVPIILLSIGLILGVVFFFNHQPNTNSDNRHLGKINRKYPL